MSQKVERFVRYRVKSPSFGVTEPAWGRIEGEWVYSIATAPWHIPHLSPVDRSRSLKKDDLEFLAPAEPEKIVALGYNYRDLVVDPTAVLGGKALEFEQPGFEPVIFLKAPNALSDPFGDIRVPSFSKETWVEVELALVMGRRVSGEISKEEAARAIFGVTIGNDVSCFKVAASDWHLARSKSLVGFCPLGPELVRGLDDSNLRLTTAINGRITQDGQTGNRILSSVEAVQFVARFITLMPGDVLLTGSPRGARQSLIRPGDQITLSIENLGSQVCRGARW